MKLPATRVQSSCCPTCGGDWSPLVTTVGVVMVICDQCDVRELVIPHAPAPEHKVERRTAALLSTHEVRAVVKKIEGGEWKSMNDAARALRVDAQELRERLADALGRAGYEALVESIHSRSYGGGHHTLYRTEPKGRA